MIIFIDEETIERNELDMEENDEDERLQDKDSAILPSGAAGTGTGLEKGLD